MAALKYTEKISKISGFNDTTTPSSKQRVPDTYVSPGEIILSDNEDSADEDNNDEIFSLGKRFTNYLDELQDLYEKATERSNFKRAFCLDISVLLFAVHPTNNTEMIPGEAFFSALGPLKIT